MKGSMLATQIDQEYRRKQWYKNKQRQKCVVDEQKQCSACKYEEVCEGDKE
jgi:radical SAM protein with 4Fe4S-binding SPASM domain